MYPSVINFSEIDFSKAEIHDVFINSDQAKHLLLMNDRNRRIRKGLVQYIRKQIKNGEWQNNHPQPIVFSSLPRLIDGQHRLIAIAESGLDNGRTVCVRVETGADDKIREYLDTGISRTLDDRVELNPNPIVNKFAAQIISVNATLRSSGHARYTPTPEDAKEFYCIHKKAIIWACSVNQRQRGTGIMSVALAAMEYYEIDEFKADEFYRDLFIPAGDCQQAQMLRDFLIRAISSFHGRTSRVEFYHKSVGCMKAHLHDRIVKRVLRSSSWD